MKTPRFSKTTGSKPSAVGPPGRTLDLGILDALRGLAALYVMLGHASGLLWAGPEDAVSSGAQGPGLALGYVTHHLLRWPHEAVLLFFLLSGFCIHYRQAKLLASSQAHPAAAPASLRGLLSLRSFAQRRLRRLYPPLVVALALTALFDYVGGQLNPAFYGSLTLASSTSAPLPSHTLATLIGNLLLQPSFAVPPFGTNGALWSLAFEAGFYILYPLLLLASARLGALGMVMASGAISLVTLLVVPDTTAPPGDSLAAYQADGTPVWIPLLLMYWLVWAMGALVAEAYAGRIRVPRLSWLAGACLAGLVVLIVTLAQFSAHPGWWRIYDLAWGADMAVLLAYMLLAAPRKLAPGIERCARVLTRLGDISYSLYVVHLPWLVLVSAWWLSWHATLPRGGELAVPGVLSALSLAGLCWYFVERHCLSPRQERRAPQPSPRSTPSTPTTVSPGRITQDLVVDSTLSANR